MKLDYEQHRADDHRMMKQVEEKGKLEVRTSLHSSLLSNQVSMQLNMVIDTSLQLMV